MPKAKSNGLTLHYQQAGQGCDLVMIHGLCSSLAFWYLSVLPALARHFRVTVYDLRGHGFSDMPDSGYTSLDMATDLRALLDHLGIERAHVAGHSFGGAVALHYAALHPERVLSLTLADARVPSLEPEFSPRNAVRWAVMRKRFWAAGVEVSEDLPRVAYGVIEEMVRLRRRKSLPRGGAKPPDLTAQLIKWDDKSHAARRWSRLMRTTSAPRELNDPSGLTPECMRKITLPTLAIFGQYSNCIPTLSELAKHLRNCQKVIVPRVGHFHPVVRPQKFVRTVKKFILSPAGEA